MPDFNPSVIDEFRRLGGVVTGRFADLDILLLTTRGRRTGLERTSPLAYSHHPDGYLVLASSGGTPNHPAWYLNLTEDPHVRVEVGTTSIEAEAHVIPEGPERDELLAGHVASSSRIERYSAKTDRVFPLVLLRRLETRSGPSPQRRS